ncbi:MAG: LysE family translocator [Flavobacteriaceae bacterium]
MLEDVQAAILPGFILSFMIGPVFFVLLETSATKGFRAALAFDLGVILADVLFITAAYFSSFKLLENLSNQPGLYILGGVILVVYGVITFFKNIPMHAGSQIKMNKGNYLNLFLKGFLLNFINVGVLVFWLLTIIAVGSMMENNFNRMAVFLGAMVSSYFITDLFKILLAKRLKRKLTPIRIRLIKKGLGLILILCGIVFVVKGFLPSDQFNIEKGIERMERANKK